MWLIVITVFCITWILAGVFRRLGVGRLDIPNERSSHLTPTPIGGLSIVLVCVAAWCVLFVTTPLTETDVMSMWVLLGGGGVIALLGYVDDQRGLPSAVRLMTHLSCAGIAVFFIGIPSLTFLSFLPGWALAMATVLATTWCLNLYNFMDGIDAIAVIETLTVGAGALLILSLSAPTHPVVSVWLILCAAHLGFLIWNKPPAKIFMGDAASGFTGFGLATTALWTSMDGVMNVWSWLILPAVFFTDATVTLSRRLIRKERLYEAHCGHGYQCSVRWLQNLWHGLYSKEQTRAKAHLRVSMSVGLVNLFWLTPLAILAHYRPEWGMRLTITAVIPLLIWIIVMHHAAPYELPEQNVARARK